MASPVQPKSQLKQDEDSLNTSDQEGSNGEPRTHAELREARRERIWRWREAARRLLPSPLSELLELLESELSEWESEWERAEREAEKHFKDAMESGYVECTITTCAVTGAAGSGKSHTMSLVFNEDPPAIRQSTGLCQPVRAISTVVGASDSGSSEWTRVDEDKVLSKVAEATSVTNTKEHPTMQYPSSLAHASSDVSSVTKGSSNSSQKTDLEKQARHTGVVDELLEKFAFLLKVSRGRRQVTKLHFLYFLDSGGQPQFHELLPSFVPNLSAILFVLKLSEKLSHNPKVEFYEKGELVCSYPSPYSHEQILKRCIRALKPEKRSTESGSSTPPHIAMVGTHRDLEHLCEGETREKKDQKLLHLLKPTFGKHLFYYKNVKKLIFPVNAKEPSQEDKAVAHVLMEEIRSSAPEPVKIPLPWFILEQVLRKLAKEKGTGVLHIGRCREVAKTLHIEHDAFDAALKYLVSLKVFLYYPDVLPNVLFCEPQVALDKINELVERYHTLCGVSNTLPGSAASACMEVISGEKWMRFQKFGVFREELLNDKVFSGHYDQDLFTPAALVMLLEALLIVGKVNTTDVIPEYVMPSLLFEIEPDVLDEHRCCPASSPAAPLLVHFPGEWPTSGVFCSFLSSLLSTCNWEVMIDDRNEPTCLYRNCLEFQHPKMLGKITLIDSFDQGYFEVHVLAPPEECKQFCPEICQDLVTALPPKAPKAELAYFCPRSGNTCCSSSPHLAKILPQRNYNYWECSEKPGDVHGHLAENMIIWRTSTQATGSSTEEPTVGYQNPTASTPTEQQGDDDFTRCPTLPKLLKFCCKGRVINIIREIGAEYKIFGILLLDDQKGARITAIAHEHTNNAYHINIEVLQEWLLGKGKQPVTWHTLIEVLKDTGLCELAKDISDNLSQNYTA